MSLKKSMVIVQDTQIKPEHNTPKDKLQITIEHVTNNLPSLYSHPETHGISCTVPNKPLVCNAPREHNLLNASRIRLNKPDANNKLNPF